MPPIKVTDALFDKSLLATLREGAKANGYSYSNRTNNEQSFEQSLAKRSL
jgi:hypothetical protein